MELLLRTDEELLEGTDMICRSISELLCTLCSHLYTGKEYKVNTKRQQSFWTRLKVIICAQANFKGPQVHVTAIHMINLPTQIEIKKSVCQRLAKPVLLTVRNEPYVFAFTYIGIGSENQMSFTNGL